MLDFFNSPVGIAELCIKFGKPTLNIFIYCSFNSGGVKCLIIPE
ncbi:hypothetical protein ADICYQ_2264 [Cyclobacterium qasimii M12-11B]|uniref:Uncharacterized protein n=1 Tax=Cyclobacterium qasimii M12-11B TaxID=641524 RepID=S7WY50_9BACT|nr:hypothetical protein ADICYQ_2264 [Cyclobacterium qasimii M12-11B]